MQVLTVESTSKQMEFEVENVSPLQSPVQMPASTEVEETPHIEEEEYFITKHKPPRKKMRPVRFEDCLICISCGRKDKYC